MCFHNSYNIVRNNLKYWIYYLQIVCILYSNLRLGSVCNTRTWLVCYCGDKSNIFTETFTAFLYIANSGSDRIAVFVESDILGFGTDWIFECGSLNPEFLNSLFVDATSK